MSAADILRGTARLLIDLGYAPVPEFTLASGRRVDLMAANAAGLLLVVEIKSSVADFRADRKWHEYLDYCDRFCFAVDAAFPQDLLPADAGLIVADRYGGELLREGPQRPLAPARRRALTLQLALAAAQKLWRDAALPPG